MTPQRAIVLARISDADWILDGERNRVLDTGSVSAQVAELLDLAEEIGWKTGPAGTHHVVENDVTAYRVRMCTLPDGSRQRRPFRPGFWRALELLRSGDADGLIAIDTDRIGRHPRDGEDFLDVVELRRIPVATGTDGDLNLNTPEGRADFRSAISAAHTQSAATSRRVRRTRRRLTIAGKWIGGPRRFGWKKGNLELDAWRWPGEVPPVPGEDGWLTGEPVPGSETAVIRAMADQVLQGVSLRQIALAVRTQGFTGAQGGVFDSKQVRTILTHPHVMGRLAYRAAHPAGVPRTEADRLYRPEDIKGPAPWPPIITEEEFWAIRGILLDPARKTTPGNTPRHLLSLLAHCGSCPAGMMTVGTRRIAGQPFCYKCRTCGALHRAPSGLVDTYVGMVVCRWLSRPEMKDLIPVEGHREDRQELERERIALRARKASQVRMHAEGALDDEDLSEGLRSIRVRLDAIGAALQPAARSPLEDLAGNPSAANLWEDMPLGLKREIIRSVAEVTLIRMPQEPGHLDPASVVLDWKT